MRRRIYEASVRNENENGAWKQGNVPVDVGATSVVRYSISIHHKITFTAKIDTSVTKCN